MRLALSDEAKMALERIQTRCREINPDIEKGASSFLYRALMTIEQLLSKDQWEQLATLTTSERMKRKRKLERLQELIEKADDSDIEKFKAKIEKKLSTISTDLSNMSAENGCVSR